MSLKTLRKELKALANPEKAKILQRFFKTGPGQYGEGDVFLGVTVPVSRSIARKFRDLPLFEITQLLKSRIHEERLIALLILVLRFAKSDEDQREKICNFYFRSTRYINNWDLVDLSAKYIVGAHLYPKNKDVLYRLAQSKSLWERRIAVIATFYFIDRKHFIDTFAIAEILISDKHDLIHKAVGWMLREVGKKDQFEEETFLRKHYQRMPRTMLRYAIERFSEPLRKAYLLGTV